MYYINLPWYAVVIWAVFALLVLLPWIAIPAIGIGAFVQGILGYKKSVARAPVGLELHPGQLGLTMADGGEEVKKDSEKEDNDNS
jgi:hypothetical protein